jgi:choice-of-anchor A domain-containing protein
MSCVCFLKVINSVNSGKGTFVGTWLSTGDTEQSYTIWNLYQTTSVIINRNWPGALLAPYAVVASNLDINGVIAVKTFVSNGEVLNSTIIIPSCV